MNCERADRVVRRFALVTLVLPVVVTTVGLMVQLAVLPQAPPRIPMYWGGSGAPSGWGPVWLPLVLTVVLGFGLPAVFGLSSLPSLRRGDRSPAFRVIGAQALGLSVLTVVATSLRLQNVGTTHRPTRIACGSHSPPGSPPAWQPLWSGGSCSRRARVRRLHAPSPRSNWRRASVRCGCARRSYLSLLWR